MSTDNIEARVADLERATMPQPASSAEYAQEIADRRKALVDRDIEPPGGWSMAEIQARADRHADLLGVARAKASLGFGALG